MIIEDGTGHGNAVAVNANGQLVVFSTMQSRMAYAANTDRMAYVWFSTYACASGDVVFYVKNTDPDRELTVNTVVIGGALAHVWKLEKVTAVGTVSGAVITPVNTVLGSGKTPSSTSFGNLAVNGVSSTVILGAIYTPAAVSAVYDTQGALVVRANDSICIRSGASGTIYTTMTGFYTPNQT
jgi:hypothetical protein